MSTLRVNNLTNQANDGGIEFAVQPVIDGLCKAWVNFDGKGTPSIRASYNVTSITDNGNGDYTVNFTTAMSDVNYCPVATVDPSIATKGNNANNPGFYSFGTSALGYCTASSAGTLLDYEVNAIAIFR